LHQAGLPVAFVVFGHFASLARPLLKTRGVPQETAIVLDENPDIVSEQKLAEQAQVIALKTVGILTGS